MKKINYFVLVVTLLLTVLSAEIFVLVKLNVISLKLLEKARSFAPRVYIVESGSMEPNIKTGSLVFSAKSDSYNRNDVVTFKNAGGLIVTHRVVYKFDQEKEYITMGDANKTIDAGKISESSILGKTLFSIPYLGYIGNFTKTPKGFILFVIIPATIIIYEELKFLKKEFADLLKKLRSKKNESFTKNTFPKTSILLPLLGCFAVFASVSSAYFSDNENSTQNVLGAASSYGEQTAALYNSNDYTCAEGATNLASPQAKVSVLKKIGGQITVTVQLVGATPNSSYDIWVNQDPGACPLATPTNPNAIITDSVGNGVGTASAPFVAGATKFWVSAVGGGQVLRSTSVGL